MMQHMNNNYNPLLALSGMSFFPFLVPMPYFFLLQKKVDLSLKLNMPHKRASSKTIPFNFKNVQNKTGFSFAGSFYLQDKKIPSDLSKGIQIKTRNDFRKG